MYRKRQQCFSQNFNMLHEKHTHIQYKRFWCMYIYTFQSGMSAKKQVSGKTPSALSSLKPNNGCILLFCNSNADFNESTASKNGF